jgi:transposase-like protein
MAGDRKSVMLRCPDCGRFVSKKKAEIYCDCLYCPIGAHYECPNCHTDLDEEVERDTA